jgi:hypothetical protein
MASTPSCRAGSRTREGAPARRRGHLCSGALAAPVLAALCCALSGLARTAAAQQAAAITATATVTASYAAYHVQPALSAARLAAGERNARGLAIPELGVLQVEGAVGAQVRLDAPAAAGRQAPRSGSYAGLPSFSAGGSAASTPAAAAAPVQVVRASIAFVAN